MAEIKPLLAGQHPSIQGVILFELAAMYLPAITRHCASRRRACTSTASASTSRWPKRSCFQMANLKAGLFPNGKPEGWVVSRQT